MAVAPADIPITMEKERLVAQLVLFCTFQLVFSNLNALKKALKIKNYQSEQGMQFRYKMVW